MAMGSGEGRLDLTVGMAPKIDICEKKSALGTSEERVDKHALCVVDLRYKLREY